MDQFIVKSDLIVENIEQQSVIELLINRLSTDSNEICIIDCTTDRKWTKQQVLDSSLNLAYYLSHDLGIQKGEVVCIASNNSDIHAITFIGVLAAGAVYFSFQEHCIESDIKGNITKTKPSVIICTSNNYEIIKKLTRSNPCIKKILLIDSQSKRQTNSNEISVEEILFKVRNPKYVLPIKTGLNDLATFVMSSGSTGQPKVILRSNQNQLAAIECLQHKECYYMTPAVIQLTTGFSHMSGQLFLMSSLNGGAKVAVIREEKDNDIVFKAINKYKITSALLAGCRLNFLAKNYKNFDKNYLSSLKNIFTGAAPMTESIHNLICKEFESVKMQNCYGMSEVGWATLVRVNDSKNQNDCLTVGKVLPNVEIKIIDEKENSLPANVRGQICIRSRQVTPGYLENLEETSKLFTRDGFLKSGDIGYYDDKHFFYIVGRIKDIIIVNTVNVMPGELEAILMTHPAIESAAVIGVKHEEFGEVPFAFVTLTKGSTVSEETIIEYVDSRVNYLKKLRGGLKILDRFPLTLVNKINKSELKKLI